MKYLLQLTIVSVLLIFYYHYVKKWLIALSARLIYWYPLKDWRAVQLFSHADRKGILELPLIAASHFIFSLLLILLLSSAQLNLRLILQQFSFFINGFYTLKLAFYSVILGVACVAISSLLCRVVIHSFALTKNNKLNLDNWMTLSRGGWIKHHLQTIEILPWYFSFCILLLQVGSEEIIFRGILLNYFLPFGQMLAIFTSVLLFIFMQIFFMHHWRSAIFPVIGATVMGFVHTFLYLKLTLLWPFIIAHISFFLFTII